MSSISEAKGSLRKKLLSQMKTQEPSLRDQKSAAVWSRIAGLLDYREAAVVFCYVALAYELQTAAIIRGALEAGKRVIVPRVAEAGSGRLDLYEIRDIQRDLSPGAFGIPEPLPGKAIRASADAIDLALIPGIAFDAKGNRLGRGLGFFDRFLARRPQRAAVLGLAFDFQCLESIPTEPHDQPVDRVIAA